MQQDTLDKVVEKLAITERTTIVLERAPEGKIRVTSGSWEGEKVILQGQVLEVRAVDGRLHVARKGRRPVAHLFCEQFTRARAVGSVTGWSCPFPLTQSQIGQVVGLSLPTVNRATQSLRKEHCAELRGGSLRILNWRRLGQQAGFDPIYLYADTI